LAEDRALPQNTEAERSLLGMVMERNDLLFEVVHIVAKSDFYEPANGEIYTLMRDMIETSREAKPITLLHDLSQNADIGGITTSEYLNRMLNEAPAGLGDPVYVARTLARTVRDLAMRRRFIAITTSHLDEAYSAPATISAADIEARYSAEISGLFTTVKEAGMVPIGDLEDGVVNEVQASLRGDTRRGLSSGLRAFDELNGALLPGRLISIAGASGSGKTALAWQIARYVGQEQTVLFNSIEMDGSELATREMSAETGISSERIDRADLSNDEFYALDGTVKKHRSLKLYVDSSKTPTVGTIRGRAMRLKRLKGLSLLVIDHLRYIKHPDRRLDIFEAMHDNLQLLNAVADDLGIPILLICQLKASYGADLKVGASIREPNVGDIFNGAVVEQESDNLNILHREEYMLARRKPTEQAALLEWDNRMHSVRGKAKLLLNKRRSGPGFGERTVGFHASSQRFSDEIPSAFALA